jgi:hypothetical protein
MIYDDAAVVYWYVDEVFSMMNDSVERKEFWSLSELMVMDWVE